MSLSTGVSGIKGGYITDSIDKLIGEYGLYLSEDVTVYVAAPGKGYYKMVAYHNKGDKGWVIEGLEGTIKEISRE